MSSVEGGTNRASLLGHRGDFAFEVRARLKDGVSASQARAAMGVLATRLAKDHPDTDPGKGITLLLTNDVIISPREQDLWMKLLSTFLLSIVGLVLAIACSNLATLLLVRGTARAKEVSVRLAIGATRWQLVRNFLIESVLLSACGAALGFALSHWTIRFLLTLIPVSFDMQMDYRVLAFTLGLSLITGIGLGLAPALRSTRVDLLPALKGESTSSASLARGWFTLKNSLLTGQVAGSFLLLIGTAFLIRTVVSVERDEPGYAVEGVAMVSTNARYAGYNEADSQRIYQELLRRIAAIPGVQAVFAGSGSTITSGLTREIEIEGGAGSNGSRLTAESAWGAPGYFETLQIPVLFGRTFEETDAAGRPRVAIVNETMARRVFGSLNVVGRRFRYGGLEQSKEEKIGVEVVGVVRDIETMDPLRGAQSMFYMPAAQGGVDGSTFVARARGDAVGLSQAMQRELRSLDPTLPVLGARTMQQQIDNELLLWRGGIAFLGAMGGAALALACVGLYAVVRFAVSPRAIELGIRMALGAKKWQVVWLVMKEMTVLIGVSIAIGSIASFAVVKIAQASIDLPNGGRIGMPAGADPLTLWLVVAVMAATGGLAAFIPARRAAKADPSTSLRHQ
jgi:predicted permease